MNQAVANLWAKTSRDNSGRWHPLILHMLDVAASAEAILTREPPSTRTRMAAVLGLKWEQARPWLLFLIACHDLGKACPGFQCKWKNLSGLDAGKSPNTDVNHAFVSQIALSLWLQKQGWPEELAELVADAVGCHHGERASPSTLDCLSGDRRAIGKDAWVAVRHEIVDMLAEVLKPSITPTKENLSGPDFMLLAGLTSFADWIGSNEEWFRFGDPVDCVNLESWFEARKPCAEQALNAIGWEPRTPLAQKPKSFREIFGFAPRSLQQAVAEALVELKAPAILLLEAPMGEGKTEAAFFAHLELQRRFGHRGLYIALPTKATGNAMFERTLTFLRQQGANRRLDLQLVHGGALLNDTFQQLKPTGIWDEKDGQVRAGEWFTNKKRALLSEYGVGTVDQALLPILPVRHNFVRLWGLANRVVVFDEIHAYDVYTGTLLIHLLRWLVALGSSVVLLSATLPPSIRRNLAKAVNNKLPDHEEKYPRLSVFQQGGNVCQRHFQADPARGQTVRLQAIGPDVSDMRTALEARLALGGMGLALLNTVQRAQDLYRLFPDGEPLERGGWRVGKRLADGTTKVFLLHARFPADRRQAREEQALELFGKESARGGRNILVATQVAEQSLDLDFDVIATDLAPIDLVLQRAGRLWRHARSIRSVSEPLLLVAGLAGDEPPSFGKPLWWGSVYREDILLRTWNLLRGKQQITLPDEIDVLVQAVYEEQVGVPESAQERLDKALMTSDGKAIAHTGQANQAIIGFPDDASWNEPARFVLYDEDEPGVHRTLMAQTRLREDSVVVIPLWPADGYDAKVVPDFDRSKALFLRAMSLARDCVVQKLRKLGVPQGWKESPLLRNCYPLLLNEDGRWIVDAAVRLDDDLGIVYEPKESE